MATFQTIAASPEFMSDIKNITSRTEYGGMVENVKCGRTNFQLLQMNAVR
jgi:hypothetical protein